MRGAVNIIPKEVLGTSYLDIALLQQPWPAWLADAFNAPAARLLIGDLRRYGLRKPDMGPARQIIGTVTAIKTGQIAVRPGIARFGVHSVVFADGREEPFDTVVLATSFRPQMQDWLHLPAAQQAQVFDARGVPQAHGQPCAAPGLFFTGFYVSPTGMLREMALQAERIATTLAQPSEPAHATA